MLVHLRDPGVLDRILGRQNGKYELWAVLRLGWWMSAAEREIKADSEDGPLEGKLAVLVYLGPVHGLGRLGRRNQVECIGDRSREFLSVSLVKLTQLVIGNEFVDQGIEPHHHLSELLRT